MLLLRFLELNYATFTIDEAALVYFLYVCASLHILRACFMIWLLTAVQARKLINMLLYI
jgi:hypothetical protein